MTGSAHNSIPAQIRWVHWQGHVCLHIAGPAYWTCLAPALWLHRLLQSNVLVPTHYHDWCLTMRRLNLMLCCERRGVPQVTNTRTLVAGAGLSGGASHAVLSFQVMIHCTAAHLMDTCDARWRSERISCQPWVRECNALQAPGMHRQDCSDARLQLLLAITCCSVVSRSGKMLCAACRRLMARQREEAAVLPAVGSLRSTFSQAIELRQCAREACCSHPRHLWL